MSKLKFRKRKCVICKKEITVWTEVLLKTHPYSRETKKISYQQSHSDEGVLFSESGKGSGVWICNECWEEILNYIN